LVLFNADYFNVLSSQIESLSGTASVIRPTDCGNQVSDYFLDRERNRLVTAEAMLSARKIADEGQLEKGKQMLQATIDKLKASISASDAQTLEYIKDMADAQNDMESRSQYSTIGAKKMAWKEQKMSKQRAAGGTDYDTNAKMQMKKEYARQQQEKHEKQMQQQQQSSASSASSTATSSPVPVSTQPAPASASSPAPDSASSPAPSTQPQPLQPQPQSGVTRKTLHVGNTHISIPEDQAEESKVTPGAKLVHDWTLYVRGADTSFIEKVTFTIHHTFTPNVITVFHAPFEISRKGWGFFNCKIQIYFSNANPPVEMIHELCFQGNGNFQEVVVNV